MKTIKATELLKPFMDKAGEDLDPYYLVHFSRTEDKYNGFWEGLDKGDVLIIVSGLCEKFGIEPGSIPVKK